MSKKICKRCKIEKDISEFHIDKSKKDGHKNICKKCLSLKKDRNLSIDRNIRQSLEYCIKHDSGFRWSSILGYDKDDIKEQLKKNFKEDMNFENYGKVWGVTFFIPKRCYCFKSLTDEDFSNCWSLKNLKPEYIKDCYKQKAVISKKDVEKYSLWDILPIGNLNKYLID